MNRGMKRLMVLMLSLLMVMTIIPLTPLKVKAASGVDDFVTRCYQVAFQRTPDQGGFNFWKAKITNGELVGSTVVYEFIFSKEYEGQNRTDKEFVNDLYTMFMGRAADQGGYDYWCGQMDAGMTRKEVFAGFANSKEFYELCYKYGITSGFYTNDYEIGKVNNVNLFVERLYKICLGRLGDQGGQKYWVEGMLKGDLTGIACAKNYVQSTEYEAKKLDNEQYVENLYIAFMGRKADANGKNYWLNYLEENEKTRDQVFEGFANSPEFQSICADYGITAGSYKATKYPLIKGKIEIGKTVRFGSYEQDNNISNGEEEIEWLVLDIQDGQALLLSKYALDAHCYDKRESYGSESVNWEESNLRKWLNNEFHNQAFNVEENQILVESLVPYDENPYYKVDEYKQNSTFDKIFILSLSEVEKYFNFTYKNTDEFGWYFEFSEEAICEPTEYAKSRGVRTTVIDQGDYETGYRWGMYTSQYSSIGRESCEWILRTPSRRVSGTPSVLEVNAYGMTSCGGSKFVSGIGTIVIDEYVSYVYSPIRPAIRVNIQY